MKQVLLGILAGVVVAFGLSVYFQPGNSIDEKFDSLKGRVSNFVATKHLKLKDVIDSIIKQQTDYVNSAEDFKNKHSQVTK